ncbi:GNAT family N-acetyltransferase [Micromonospora yangpuensis]|uniref:GNAT family N-acetyltransferase n=1 Tax=Micromonospora yangpuensis TaxID=683228 RepID=UPI001E37807C|nr:GNAT family N-acetyltransferase [Micromonospora yangpuensis]
MAYAQGRATALDRAWQLEVERHRAQGTSATFLGVTAVEWDTFARRARLADTARRCHANLDPETAAWVGAYVDGVNAGLTAGAQRAPEFAATGLRPGRWEPWVPLALWLSAHILFAGFPGKLWRTEVARHLGDAAIDLFAVDGPATAGSNGWLITGERTATGGPLIAGDPHRIAEDPNVYQQVRLTCPEYDVVGLAVPGVPGIAHFGHAGPVAWAITNAMADYQDLYAERLRRTPTGVQALGPDGWADATAHVETIEVADADPVQIEVLETERGPIIIGGLPDGPTGLPANADGPPAGSADGATGGGLDRASTGSEGADSGGLDGGAGDRPAAISLRYPPRVRGELGFAVLPALLRARTVADVDRALDGWAEPVNVVLAADTEGGLLHRVAGAVPVRHRDNGRRVVPAWEPGYAWQGWHAPMARAEVDGIAVMANQRGLATPYGVEFAPPYRADRIAELLDAGTDWTAERMAEIHTDTYLPSAQPLLTRLAGLDGLTPAAAALRDRLLAWDRRMTADSADAAAYATVRHAVVRHLAGQPPLAGLAGPLPYPEVFRPWLALTSRVGFALNPLLAGATLPELDRDAALRAGLEQAVADLEPGVVWGDRHRPAPWRVPAGPPEEFPGLAGDHDCVLSTSSVPGVTDLAFRVPVARYVWDLHDRAASRWVVPFGASGVPGDPHHRDQLPHWAAGDLLPVVTDWGRLGSTTDVPGFGQVTIRPVDPVADVELIHSWVGQERARFWGMRGLDRERVGEIYAYLDSLDTHHAYLLRLDGVPVALFQTYQPEHDPVGECYDVRPGDFGIHLMIGPPPPDGVQPGFTGTLLRVFLDFVLSTPGRTRLLAEPDARNDRAIARLVGAGFVPGPQIDLPEKRAQLLFLDPATRYPACPDPATAEENS